jgi:glycosyltransferase involved in cell wall biosynthesis
MINKTEQQIMQNWKSNEMVVSITCVAFNHEYCIADALDSFLSQETDFAFEVLINDDCSTDKTVEILKAYESKYPHIVKPVYQTENQFSQGVNTMAILFPKVTGKYVAFCDGDDYWTDNEKLTIQVDELEKHPELDMCFHSSYKVKDGKEEGVHCKQADHDKIFTTEEVILGGGVFCPTASILFTNRLISILPKWFYTAIPGDFSSQIMGSVKGGALYIDRCMAAYRVGVDGSWSCSELLEKSHKRKEMLYSFTEKLDFIKKDLNNKFQKEINLVIHNGNLDFINTRGIDVSAREEVYQKFKHTFSLKEKLLWHFLYRNQNLLNVLKFMKDLGAKPVSG